MKRSNRISPKMGTSANLSSILFLVATMGLDGQAFAYSLPVPCKEKMGWAKLRSCKDVLNGVDGNALASPGVLSNLRKSTQERIDGYYAHKDGAETLPSNVTYCNLVENPFVAPGDGSSAVPPYPRNHTTESCGPYANITVNISLSTMFGCIVGGSWNTVYDNAPPRAQVEASYIRSGQILANSCNYQYIRSQVEGLSLNVANDSSCLAAAQAVKDMLQEFKKYNDNSNFDIKCLEGWETNSEKFVDVTQGKDKQASQMLCGMRSRIEAAFTKVATCEINDRAMKKFLREIGGQAAQEVLSHALDREITSKCASSCASQFGVCSNLPNTGSVSACVNQCYQTKLAPFMKDYLSQRFGSCQ